MVSLLANTLAHDCFIPNSMFQQCADLDGTLAAKFLIQNGCTNVQNMDIGTNGLAIGNFEGRRVWLSTNGWLSWHDGDAYPMRWKTIMDARHRANH